DRHLAEELARAEDRQGLVLALDGLRDAHGALLQDVHLASGLSLTKEHVTRRARLAESSEELVASGHVVMGRPYAGGGDAQPRYVTRRSLLGWRRAVKIHRLGPPRSHP